MAWNFSEKFHGFPTGWAQGVREQRNGTDQQTAGGQWIQHKDVDVLAGAPAPHHLPPTPESTGVLTGGGGRRLKCWFLVVSPVRQSSCLGKRSVYPRSTVEFDSGKWWHVGFNFFFLLNTMYTYYSLHMTQDLAK